MSGGIGYVAKVFPRLSETFVLNEIRELERQGEAVRVFSLQRPPADVPHGALRDLRAKSVCVEAEPVPSEEDVRVALKHLVRQLGAAGREDRLVPRKYVRLALQMAPIVRAHRLERLHAHFATRAAHVAMLVGALEGIPFSFTAHAKDIYHESVDREVLREKMRQADTVVTVTEYNRKVLYEIGAGLPGIEAKVRRLYNGVDLSKFEPLANGQRVTDRILGVGRLVEKKGFSVLVDACAALRDRGVPFTCDIVGDGPQEAPLRAQVAAHGLEACVRLRGAAPAEQVAAEMQAASMVVLPCIVAADGNVDALPTVLLEAMGCNLPAVSTRLSGIPEIIVDGETGYLTPPGDAAGLSEALARLLTDPEAARRMGLAGRARAEQLFDLTRNVATLRSWFRPS